MTKAYEEAKSAVRAGKAVAHHLWVLLSHENQRDGYALKPSPWEGPGEYQHVTFDGEKGIGRLVRVPCGEHI